MVRGSWCHRVVAQRRRTKNDEPKTKNQEPCLACRLQPTSGEGDHGCAGLELQFLTNVRTVNFHGFRADMQLVGDARGGFSTADMLEYLELAVSEAFERRKLRFVSRK